MKIRDLLRLAVFVVGSFLHLYLEWYGWKIHLGEFSPPGDLGDRLWQVLSFPLFTLLSRRIQTLHFYELLLLNSVLWGAALVWVVSFVFRPRARGTKLSDLAARTSAAAAAGGAPPHPAKRAPGSESPEAAFKP